MSDRSKTNATNSTRRRDFTTCTGEGQKLSHLTLAEGEVTAHKHRISEGQAELSEKDGTLYLRVLSEVALLTHNLDIEPSYFAKNNLP